MSLASEDICPYCHKSLIGEPIPEKYLEAYGGQTHFRRNFGIEIRNKYDGVSYWKCPDCGAIEDRWTGQRIAEGVEL